MSQPIFICEDNPVELKHLNTLIENYLIFHDNFFRLEYIERDPKKILHFIKKSIPVCGTYFLDIDLKSDMNGIDLAAEIRNLDTQANIVFTTTHEELAPETLKRQVGAIGFIEKEQNLENYRDNIYKTLDHIESLMEKSQDYHQQNFTFEIGSQIFNFNQNEVFSVESSPLPHQLIFTSDNGQYEFYGKLNELEKKYPFMFRISRSCLVNPINIRNVDFLSRNILLKNGFQKKFSIGKATKLKSILLSQN